MKDILIPLITLLVGLVIAFPAGIAYRRKVAEAELGSAEEEAKRVLSDAIKTAESKKKEALVEAKDEIFKLRSDADREIKDRRNEADPSGAPPAAAGGKPGQKGPRIWRKMRSSLPESSGKRKTVWQKRRRSRSSSLNCWKRSPVIPPTRPRNTCSRTSKTELTP